MHRFFFCRKTANSAPAAIWHQVRYLRQRGNGGQSVHDNRFFLSVLVSGIFSDSNHKVKVDRLQVSLIFQKDGAVCYFLDDARILMVSVKRINDAFPTHKFLCKFFHFCISFQLSFPDDLSQRHGLLPFAKRKKEDQPQDDDR